MEKKLFIFIKSITFSLTRQRNFIIVSLIIFSQSIYSSSKNDQTPSYNECHTFFTSIHPDVQSKSQKLKKERNVILSEPIKYRGPDGYETYIQEYPESFLGVSFKNILSVFSKEELELMEWHYIEFDGMKFGKMTQIKGKKVFVNYIDNKSIKTRKLSKKQLRTVQPSSIARGRMRFREALEKAKFTEDERYIVIPSLHLSDQYGRILEVSQDTVIAEIMGYNGKLRKSQLSQKHLLIAQVDPVSKDWFNKIEQSIEKLEPLHLIEENEEEHLTKQNYKQSLIQGVNTANRLIKSGKHIRQSHINPFSTHIADFARQIPDHIEAITKGIASQDIEVSERLNLLKQFEMEAYRKVEDEAVTYMWWLFWNKRLSILATPSQKRKEQGNWWKSEENLENFLENLNEEKLTQIHKDEQILLKFIQKFPDQIILPTASDLGPMAFNRAFVHSTALLQLVGKAKWMDGQLNTPEKAFSHDINHAVLQFEEENLPSSSLMKLFYQQISDINNLTVYEREAIEIVYFLITHERQWVDISQPQTVVNMMIDKNMQQRFQDTNDLRNWIEEDIKHNTLKSHLRKMAKTFNRSIASVFKK